MLSTEIASFDPTLSEVQDWSALGGGLLAVVAGASRRSLPGLCLALAGTPLLYRGLTGRWPSFPSADRFDTRIALGGERGLHVREAVRLEKPIGEVYAYWRRLEHLPLFMEHLASVRDLGNGRSHWVARGPAEVRVEWDAEIVNEVENQVIGWRSLPDSDVVTAGSVNFDSVRQGQATQVTVHLQYAPPAGRAGALVAALFGRAPSQTIREDLRRLKQILEAGELARAAAPEREARQ